VNSVVCVTDSDILHSHRDYEQVILDVKRSMKRFPPGSLTLQSITLLRS